MRKISYPLLLFLLSFMGMSEVVVAESVEIESSTAETTEKIKQSETRSSQSVKEESSEKTIQSRSSDEKNGEETDSISPQVLGGSGRKADPFTVTTFDELRSAISSNEVDPADGIKYVRLMNDIVVNLDNVMTIGTNIEVNGIKDPNLPSTPDNYYQLNYTAGAGGTMFRTLTYSNLNVTFKNLNIGSDNYPRNTYYGFVRITGSNTTLNVENINYNIQEGSQPFFAETWANYCTLNISGTNVYNSPNTTAGYGGEFVEGYTYVNFKKDSKTKIVNYTSLDETFFYRNSAPNLTVTAEKNADVDIYSARRNMFWPGNGTPRQKIVLEEDAKFSYKVRNRAGAQKNELILSDAIDVEMRERSDFEYLTKDTPIDMKVGLYVQAFDPARLHIGKTADSSYSGGAIQTGDVAVWNRGSNFYQAITSNNNVINGVVPPWAADNQNNNVYFINTEGGYRGKDWIEYLPSMSLDSVSATSNVGHTAENGGFSNVDSILGKFETGLNDDWVFKAEYILSKTPYTDSDGRLDQAALRNVFDAQNKPEGVYTFSGDEIAVPSGEDRSFEAGHFEDLLAQNYYIYGRVRATRTSDNYTGATLWVANTVNVPQHIATVFPTSMSFYSLKGPVLTWPNEKYLVESYSNVPTYITMTDMAVGENSDPSVTLVGAPSSGDSLLNLDFLATLEPSKNKTIWPAYTSGNGQVLTLSPYFEDDSQAEIGFDGSYSGPYYSVKNVNYHLKFNISGTNP